MLITDATLDELLPVLVLTDEDVRRSFQWKEAIAALEAVYSEPCSPAMVPNRTMARGDGVWLRTLSAVAPDGTVMGAKIISAAMKSKLASYLIALFDQNTSALLALLDANTVTGLRTAATSALAADRLAVRWPLSVAVVGSGFEARKHLQALAAIRSIRDVRVFSPTPTSRVRFAEEMVDIGAPVVPAESARQAIAGAHLVICAARSRDESPTIQGAWLEPGMTVVSIGSTLPEQREVDPETVSRADMIVADMVEEIAHDTGDMLAARAAGVDFETKLVSLASVVRGETSARTSPSQILMYKSVGSGMQDIAVAAMCVQRARQLGLGTPLPVSITPVRK
jgi:alanine dehydrogenase